MNLVLKLAALYFAWKIFKWVFFRPFWIVLALIYFFSMEI